MRNLLLIPLTIGIAFLSGCGDITGIMPTKPHNLSELTGYDKIIVMDFNDSTKSKEPEKVKSACKDFADKIAGQIIHTGAFTTVNRAQTADKAIALTGTITKYEESSILGRVTIVAGGSSYFCADVVFKDNDSGNELATLKVSKNSCAVGGSIASIQTVDGFMNEAADKVAKELANIRKQK